MKIRIDMKTISAVLAVLLFAAALCWFLIAVSSAQSASDEQRLEALKSSVENSITLCYSIEGAYPESLEYLTEHYGVHYDDAKYLIHYDCFAANIRPGVTVIERVQ